MATRINTEHPHDIAKAESSRPTSRIHDTTGADQHLTDLSQFGKDINDAVRAVWPYRSEVSSRYTQVQVLLLSWVEDDLGVKKEIAPLHHVFNDLYGFEVESYEIASVKPDKAIKRRIFEFLDYDSEDTLLVVYYAGHTRLGLQPSSSSIWFA